MFIYCFFFFFSSRRRHTRLVSDWSSDVCSSDLSRYVDTRPGGRGRVSTYLDEIEGQEVEGRSECRVEKEGEEIRRGERPDAKKSESRHGMVALALDGGESGERRPGGRERAPDAEVRPVPPRRLDQSEHDPPETSRGQQSAGNVEPSRT